MRKVLAVVLWAWIPFCWQPLWGQAPGVRVEAAHKLKQQPKLTTTKTANDQRGTKDSPLIVEIYNRPKTEEEAAKAKTDKDYTDSVNRWTLRFAGAAAVCTGLLVLVGGLGVCYAIKTLREMSAQRKTMEGQLGVMEKQNIKLDDSIRIATQSAEAALRSANLQEAQLRQWIQVKDWEVLETIDRNRLWVRCKVVNPTVMQLTIRDVKWWTTYGEMPAADAEWPLSPGEIYPPQFPIMLWGKLQDDFEKGKIRFAVALTIDFEDALGAMRSKRFCYNIECGRDGPCVVSPAWGSTQVKEKGENPN